jgi:hypothetical protein
MTNDKLIEAIEDARAMIEVRIPERLNTKDPDGKALGKRFTKPFLNFLDHPPLFMQVLRERRFSRKHWEHHWRRGREGEDREWQVPWINCGCEERLGYRLVQGVVIERRTLGDMTRTYNLSRLLAKRILESELRVIFNQVEARMEITRT